MADNKLGEHGLDTAACLVLFKSKVQKVNLDYNELGQFACKTAKFLLKIPSLKNVGIFSGNSLLEDFDDVQKVFEDNNKVAKEFCEALKPVLHVK